MAAMQGSRFYPRGRHSPSVPSTTIIAAAGFLLPVSWGGGLGKPAFRALLRATVAFATLMMTVAESSGGDPPGTASTGAPSADAVLIDVPEGADGEPLERPLDPEETQDPAAPELWYRPRVAMGIDAGFAHYWNGRPAKDWGFGVAQQLRAGVQWSSIVATDIRWFGIENTRVEFDLLTTGFSMDVRLSIPLPVRPFLAVGLGWHTTLLYDDRGLVVSPPVALQVPLSAGVEVPVWRGIGVQLEFAHRFLAEGAIADVYPAAMQLWSVTAGARAYF